MSRDPRCKFCFFYFPNSIFYIRKITKFLLEKLSTSEVISQKPQGGGGGGGGERENTVPLGFIKNLKKYNLDKKIILQFSYFEFIFL